MPDIIILSIFSLIQSAVIHWLIKKWYKEKIKNVKSKKLFTTDEVLGFVKDQSKRDTIVFYKKLSNTLEDIVKYVETECQTKEEIVKVLKDLADYSLGEAGLYEFNSIAKTHVQTEGK